MRWQNKLAPATGAGRRALPGLLLTGTVAWVAMALAARHGGPVMLFALLLGMALHPLPRGGSWQAGIDVAARQLLRLGVALLGLRITIDQVLALGWQPLALVVAGVVLTLACGLGLARLLGLHRSLGWLTGGAVGICGASAALALSAALPAHALKERATLFTVIGVSTLSTLAMVLYPLLVQWLQLPPHAAGLFIGGTIHDVAQVVGAGYSLSPQAGDTATLIKLVRVSMLLPVIALTVWLARRGASGTSAGADERVPWLPGFAVAFAALVLVNSTGVLPTTMVDLGRGLSHTCLVSAMAAIGMKTRLQDILALGWRPIVLILAETLLLALVFAVTLVKF